MNTVYIATSLDGYIADANDGLDWLNTIPNPEGDDMGFADFMNRIDALLMGRRTFEVISAFGGEWPYKVPVFVLSNSLSEIPRVLKDKVTLIKGEPAELVRELSQQGFEHLYIDGGATIQSFLQADLIDELIITTMPILLGDGVPLFGKLDKAVQWELVSSTTLLGQLVQNHYIRK